MRQLSLILLFSFMLAFLNAQEKAYPEIIEKLGEMVPIEKIHFFDESGKEHSLKEYGNGKPIVIALAFFQCTSICMPFINGVGDYVDENKGSMQAGKDFELLTISFDATENSEMATTKKKNQFEAMHNKRPYEAWHFLTGNQESITELTEKVGFKFVPYVDQKGGHAFLHKSAMIILSPEGKVVRYIAGDVNEGRMTYFNHFEVDLAISEAYKGIAGPTFSKVLNVCFKYDPANKKYTLRMLQVFGTLIMFCALALFLSVTLLSKKPKNVNDSVKKEDSK